jgi:hypothetical protein
MRVCIYITCYLACRKCSEYLGLGDVVRNSPLSILWATYDYPIGTLLKLFIILFVPL